MSEAIYGNRQANQVGLLQAEANLRRLIGLAQSTEELLKPNDQPNVGDIQYDWTSQSQQALGNRVELREQRSRIKRRELELLGVRNFALPRLDAVAIYRNNGFGDDLIGRDVGVPFSNAFDVANDSQFEEWEVGLQMAVPVGYRRAFSAIRNAELQLNRERLILAEQKKEVLHGLGTSMRAIFNFFKQSEIATNRLSAASDTVEARKAAYEAGAGSFNELLEAQRNLATSKQSYYQATINWAIGLAEVDQQTGQLLANYGVFFDEVHSSLASN